MMRKLLLAAALPAALLLAELSPGAALAHSPERAMAVGAPQPIAEVRPGGPATVAGTVIEAGPKTLTVADDSGRLTVRLRHLDPEALKLGQQVTVIGWIGEEGMKAGRVILQDGTAVGGHGRRGHCDGERRI